MKNKGFTLTEILAVIVILGILVAIATPVYFSISNNTKKNELQTKINYIKTKALKYAEEQGLENSTTIITATLIADGYITAEEYKDDEEYGVIPYISNPTDKKDNLACRIININMDGYEFTADVTSDENCDLINEENSLGKLGIRAFKYDGNKLGKELNIKDGEFEWSNTDVMLVVNPQYSDIVSARITQKGTTLEIGDNKLTDPSDGRRIDKAYSNTIVVSTDLILKESISVTVQTKTEVNNKTVVVKIDKENPYIKTSQYDGWTKEGKKASIIVGDGNGSGPKGIYVNKTSVRTGSETLQETGENGYVQISNIDNGAYYIWAVDNAGNISNSPHELIISNVDNVNPECKTFGNDKWTNQKVDVGFVCSDYESGCAKDASKFVKTIDKSMKTTNISIKKNVTFYDNMGNSVTCPKKAEANVYVDKTKPTLKLTAKSSVSSYNSTRFTITLTASDKDSGIKSVCIIPINNNKDPHKSTNCDWINVEASKIDEEHNQGPLTYTYNLEQEKGNHFDKKSETFKYYAYAMDTAGNISKEYSINYKVYEICDKKEIYDYGKWGDCDGCCGGKKTRTTYRRDKFFKEYKCSNGTDEDDCNDCCGGGGDDSCSGKTADQTDGHGTGPGHWGYMCNGQWHGGCNFAGDTAC